MGLADGRRRDVLFVEDGPGTRVVVKEARACVVAASTVH